MNSAVTTASSKHHSCSLRKKIRYFLFSGSEEIDKKTEEIDRTLKELREKNEEASNRIRQLKQHDMLRSLVISMNAGRNK